MLFFLEGPATPDDERLVVIMSLHTRLMQGYAVMRQRSGWRQARAWLVEIVTETLGAPEEPASIYENLKMQQPARLPWRRAKAT